MTDENDEPTSPERKGTGERQEEKGSGASREHIRAGDTRSDEAPSYIPLVEEHDKSITPDFGSPPSPEYLPMRAAGWQNDKRVTALWGIAFDQDCWVFIDGIGWKKLAFTSVTGTLALSMIAASAKRTGARVNYREESDGLIYEMYVW